MDGLWLQRVGPPSSRGAGCLTVAASPVAEPGLQSAGSVVVVDRLSCPVACEIFPDQGSNPCPLHWQADT